MLLCLNSLVQAIAPATTFHDTTSLFVDNLNLTIQDNILIILIEHCVCLQELLQRVYTFTLNSIVSHQRIFLVDICLLINNLIILLLLKCRKLCGNIR